MSEEAAAAAAARPRPRGIAGGTFACVFDPPLPCAEAPPPSAGDYLGKVMYSSHQQTVDEDLAGAMLMQAADPAQEYHMASFETCTVAEAADPVDWGACAKDAKTKDTSVLAGRRQIFTTRGEMPVHRWLKEADPTPDLIYHGLLHLARGMDRLAAAGVFHGDLKLANTVVVGCSAEAPCKFMMIDFGFAGVFEKFKEIGGSFNLRRNEATKWFWVNPVTPPECLFPHGKFNVDRCLGFLREQRGSASNCFPVGADVLYETALFEAETRKSGIFFDGRFKSATLFGMNQYCFGLYVASVCRYRGLLWHELQGGLKAALVYMLNMDHKKRFVVPENTVEALFRRHIARYFYPAAEAEAAAAAAAQTLGGVIVLRLTSRRRRRRRKSATRTKAKRRGRKPK